MARQSDTDKAVLGEAPLEPRPLGELDPDGRGAPAEPEKVGDDDEPPELELELLSPLAS